MPPRRDGEGVPRPLGDHRHRRTFSDPGSPLDLGNSGTGLRMLTSVAALQNFPIGFDGDSSLRTRLMSGLLTALEKLGAKVESQGGKCPFRISGPLRGGATKVDGTTSQFLTSLLFALPLLREDSTIELEFLHEKPYVGITLAWLDALGIRWSGSGDMLHWRIPGGQSYRAFERVIPADFSTAAFPLVAAAVAGEGWRSAISTLTTRRGTSWCSLCSKRWGRGSAAAGSSLSNRRPEDCRGGPSTSTPLPTRCR
ncbi:MAG: hypothetical protein L6W00_04425 [Lentisphaeria bacterium]|nr:MAG: hypothetical protein L6W00_04425 [Lentisphaeria bacterium]